MKYWCVELQQKGCHDYITVCGVIKLRFIPGKDRAEAKKRAKAYILGFYEIDCKINGVWIEKEEYWGEDFERMKENSRICYVERDEY